MMQAAGLRPDKYTCTILMKGLHEQSTPKQLSQALDMVRSVLPQCDSALSSSLFRGLIQAAARLDNAPLLMHAFSQMQQQNVALSGNDYQLIIQTLAQNQSVGECSSIWSHAFRLSKGSFGSQR